MLRIISKIALKISGWEAVSKFDPSLKRAVAIAAPHTSNWDFFYAITSISVMRFPLKILIKDSLFFFPLGYILKKLGGVSVDRSHSNDFVNNTAKIIKEADEFYIGMAPEGTRSKSDRWKSGFYYLAIEAGVPIIVCYIDYKKKQTGIYEIFKPTGDKQKDFEYIKSLYKDVTPKFPENWNLEGITNSKV